MILDRVPMWLRTRWPMKRFYWQADEITNIERNAEKLRWWIDGR